MQPLGEIKESNRYQTQPAFDGGFVVIDRVNGFRADDTVYTTGEEARERATALNSPRGIPA